MNESIIEKRKQREKSLGRWENEGGEVLPAATPDLEKAAAVEYGSRKKADCGDADGAVEVEMQTDGTDAAKLRSK